jgi:SAM-dependent methyltransferase
VTDDRLTALFFELFSGLPRQGPGDAASTLRALALVPGIGSGTRVLDVGCGTGLQTRVLAEACSARFLGVDSHAPYVEAFNREAEAHGLAHRVEARVGDMRQLDFPGGSFDVIWCEGAIYNIGFETGLREWRRLLAPGGHMAVTEVCWTRPDPPPECAAFWASEYPAIRDVRTRLETIERCGYDLAGHFTLPPSSWWNDYYAILEEQVREFRTRHSNEPDARRLADGVQREIEIWRAYSEFYGYVFFVMRAR